MSGCGQFIRPYPLKFFGTHLNRLFADYDPADSSAWATLFEDDFIPPCFRENGVRQTNQS